MTRRIHIAVPTYSGDVNASAMLAMMRAQDEAYTQGWKFDVAVRPMDSLLPRCRNAMLTKFWESGADDLLFWDADVAPAPGAFTRLMNHPVEFVAGVYPARSDPERYIFRKLPGPEICGGELLEVEGVPTGFMRITRLALARMIEADPEAYLNDRALGRLIWLFDFEKHAGEYWSEDFVFCRRWRAIGGRIWVDPEIPFHHIGPKAFPGRLGDQLRREAAARVTPVELQIERERMFAMFNEAVRSAA